MPGGSTIRLRWLLGFRSTASAAVMASRSPCLLALAETQSPTARYGNGAYRTHRTHLIALLTLADAKTDATYLADALLAVLGGGLFLHHRRNLQFSTDRIKIGIDQLLTGLAPTLGPVP